MNAKRHFGMAAVTALCLGAAANAQPLMNGDFETVDPNDSLLPQGWVGFNGAQLRTVGDGLNPPLPAAHSGVRAVALPAREFGPSDFAGLTSDALLDPSDPVSPRNNPGYTFDPPDGDPITVGAWIMIPASDPIVLHRVGLKLEFRRTINNSIYEGFDLIWADPVMGVIPPGAVAVTTPTGPGVHTNGEWVQFTTVFEQSRFTIPLWPEPPENPFAKATVLAIRTGDPFPAGARGTVFFDDITFEQGGEPPCIGDFNMSGEATVQDIFDFLSAYFSNDPRADINGVGGITVQDIFDFLAAYFAGCP